MTTRRIAITLLCVLISIGMMPRVHAQSQQIDKLTPETLNLIRNIPVKDAYKQAGAVILLKEGRMRVEKDGTYRFSLHVIGKVLDKKAALDYGQVVKYFNLHNADVNLDFARTIRKNGDVMPVSPDAVQTKTLMEGEYYTEERLLTFSFPALEEESAFEFQWTRIQKRPLIQNNWYEFYDFNYICPSETVRVDPVFRSKLVLELPIGDDFVFHTQNTEVRPRIEKKAGSTIYSWELKQLPEIPIEDYMPPIVDLIPTISVSSIRSWTLVDRWASELFLPAIEASPVIKAKALEVTQGTKSEFDKIRALFNFIETNIRYVEAGLESGGYRPHPASEVLRNRYGDCKDQVVLFISLLKALGIKAHPAFLNMHYQGEIDPDVPTPSFSHAITYIPAKDGEGKTLWLDTVSKVTQFPHLFWKDQGRWALIIDGKGGKLVRTPKSSPEENQGMVNVSFRPGENTFAFTSTVAARGALSDVAKSHWRSIPMARRKDEVIRLMESVNMLIPANITSVSDIENPEFPFSATAVYETPAIFNPEKTFDLEGNSLKALPAFTDLPRLTPPENRRNDYLFPFKTKIISEFTIQPPVKEMGIVSIPKDRSVDSRFFSLSTRFLKEGDTMRVRGEFILKENLIRKADYEEFYQNMQSLLKSSKWKVVFARQTRESEVDTLENAVNKNPQDAKALVNLASYYLTRGKYQEAKGLLERASAVDPKSGRVHYLLGVALGHLDQYDAARTEFETAQSLGYVP